MHKDSSKRKNKINKSYTRVFIIRLNVAYSETIATYINKSLEDQLGKKYNALQAIISYFEKEQIEPKLASEQSVKLVSEKHKKLYRLKGGDELLWGETSNKLQLADPDFKNLGNAAQSLMPLFAELANESF